MNIKKIKNYEDFLNDLKELRSNKINFLDILEKISMFVKNYYGYIKNSIKYHVYFHKAISEYYPWDYSHDLRILIRLYEKKLYCWRENHIYVGQEKDTRDLKIFLECLRRLYNDDFIDHKFGSSIRKNTLNLVQKKFKKVIRLWM